jgi:hypothetical protein
VWPFRAKYCRKRERISEASILSIYRSLRADDTSQAHDLPLTVPPDHAANGGR